MKPKFIFTLGGDLGDHIISEPEGWATIIFNLERDLTYWSLIENFELPLIFYGIAQGNDGGYDYLSSAINNGIDTLVTIDIQVSWDGVTYENCFDGRIDLSTSKETIYRAKIQAAIVRNDLWAMFMANKSKPVDLLSSKDIYGNQRYGIPRQELNLPSQKIIKNYSADLSVGQGLFSSQDGASASGKYLQFDWDEETLTEIKTKFQMPISINPSLPANIFEMDEDGSYYFDIRFEISLLKMHLPGIPTFSCPRTDTYSNCEAYIDFYIKKNNEAEILFSFTPIALGLSTEFRFAQNFDLKKGDQIFIYAKLKVNMPNDFHNYYTLVAYGKTLPMDVITSNYFYDSTFNDCNFGGVPTTYSLSPPTPSGFVNPTYINVIGNTSYIDTSCDTLLVHDVALSICDRILGKDDSFYSSFFGGAKSAIIYNENGCGYLNTLTRGLNIRGYSFSEKPFTLNFDDWWAGVNPVFNLGLGYEELGINSPNSTVIRVEDKGSFFNPSPSIYLTGVNDITVEFDLNLFTKTIKIGCETWEAETISGIDDPQTNHIYNLRYQLFGKDETQLSKFILASLAWEETRRLTKVQSQDWRLDENVFMVALQEQDNSVDPQTSPPTITQQPELISSGVTGLNNSETRYNIRRTPARFLNRWSDFYSGQMQDYLTDSFKFGSGEGNILMSWTGDGACDSGTLIENQNIPISSTYLFLPVIYSFTHPLTWIEYTTIRNNRKNAISISWVKSGIVHTKIAFIKKLSYDINKSKGTFEVWIKFPPPISGDGGGGDIWQWFSGDNVLWFSGDGVEL